MASDQTSQQRTLNEIDRRLGSIDVVRVSQPTYVKLALPAARGADFHFNVYVYDDGEPQITAQPRVGGGDLHDVRDLVAFWHLSFEAPDFLSDDDRLNAFLAVLGCLLTHDVRIRQRRGWLNYSFTCEYQADDRWIALPGVSYLRWTLRPAAPEAGVLCFSSPPLLPATG